MLVKYDTVSICSVCVKNQFLPSLPDTHRKQSKLYREQEQEEYKNIYKYIIYKSDNYYYDIFYIC